MTSTQLGRLKLKLETRLKELSSSLRNRENIAVERTPDALDEVELAGERDLAISSLDKCFAQIRLVEAALAAAVERGAGQHPEQHGEAEEHQRPPGAQLAEQLDYVPMPENVVKLVEQSWQQIKGSDGKPVWTGRPS